MTNAEYKKDCFFFGETREMEGIIPYCDYYNDFAQHCFKCECDKYIQRKSIFESVKRFVDER